MTNTQRDSRLNQEILEFFANPNWLSPLTGPIIFFSIAFQKWEQTLEAFDVPSFGQPRK